MNIDITVAEVKLQTEKITVFLKKYLLAFKRYDLNKVVACYYLPCVLHTPDQIVLLRNDKACQQELTNIFNQLQQAKTSDIIASNTSYSVVTDNVFIVNVDWKFLDEHGEIFTDFCTIYHLILIDNKLKIMSVVSHELSNSQSFDYPFMLTD